MVDLIRRNNELHTSYSAQAMRQNNSLIRYGQNIYQHVSGDLTYSLSLKCVNTPQNWNPGSSDFETILSGSLSQTLYNWTVCDVNYDSK